MIIPEYISLKDWSASLIIDFPLDNIPILEDDNNWRLWGNLLIETKSFAINYAPGTQGYPDWKSWAKDLFFTMNNT